MYINHIKKTRIFRFLEYPRFLCYQRSLFRLSIYFLNGAFTTTAFSLRPRTSINISVPNAVQAV